MSRFGELVFLLELLCHCIDDAVDVATALGGAVPLCYLNIFVDCDRNRYLWKTEQFGNCYLHDDNIHVSEAIKFPIFDALTDKGAVVLVICDSAAEEADGKILVFDVLVFGH